MLRYAVAIQMIMVTVIFVGHLMELPALIQTFVAIRQVFVHVLKIAIVVFVEVESVKVTINA
jgi:hypothetical protein